MTILTVIPKLATAILCVKSTRSWVSEGAIKGFTSMILANSMVMLMPTPITILTKSEFIKLADWYGSHFAF